MNIFFTKELSNQHTICVHIIDDKPDVAEGVNLSIDVPKFEGSMLYHGEQRMLLVKSPKDYSTKAIAGNIMSAIAAQKITNALIIPIHATKENIDTFLLGIELSAYRFNHYYSPPRQILFSNKPNP